MLNNRYYVGERTGGGWWRLTECGGARELETGMTQYGNCCPMRDETAVLSCEDIGLSATACRLQQIGLHVPLALDVDDTPVLELE